MNRFLFKGPLLALSVGDKIILDRDQSLHLSRVLRLKAGDMVEVFDGDGYLAHARIMQVERVAELEVVALSKANEPVSRLTICFGIPKSQAAEFILRRCTELGVAGFIPLATQHSLSEEKWNVDRARRILSEASKQCQTPFLPHLHSPIPFMDWVKTIPPDQLIVCDEEERTNKVSALSSNLDYFLLIGSEGGWNEEERKFLSERMVLRLGLGKNRLRTETATLVAAVLIKQLIGEL